MITGIRVVRIYTLMIPEFAPDFVFSESLARRVLSDVEYSRFRAYRVRELKNSFVASRLFLRALLEHLNRGGSRNWQILKSESGQPYLHSPDGPVPWHISLTRTRGLYCCAISQYPAVGCDVEMVSGDPTPIVRSFFAPLEIAQFENLQDDERRSRFFEIWTLKEAFVKADGRGLSLPLDTFWFDFDSRTPDGAPTLNYPAGTHPADPTAWRFWLHRPTRCHQLAAAVLPRDSVEFRHCPVEPEQWNTDLAEPWRFSGFSPSDLVEFE